MGEEQVALLVKYRTYSHTTPLARRLSISTHSSHKKEKYDLTAASSPQHKPSRLVTRQHVASQSAFDSVPLPLTHFFVKKLHL